MHVPVVVIDRLAAEDRKLLRTELRRQLFSAYEVENRLIVITGRIDFVRLIMHRTPLIGVGRCRMQMVDGEEMNQAHDEPGQFKDLTKRRIHQFRGLDSATGMRLCEALNGEKIEAGIVDETDGTRTVLAEFDATRHDEVAEVVGTVLGKAGYQFAGARKEDGEALGNV